jgi:HD-GYP domain-containing protein (c-di-GMP phosphodiesterase class II)
MIAFGRHLCLPSDELSILGLGGLLMDIGQLKQPANVKKDKASDFHVFYGEQILSQIPSIPEKVLQITSQHHEREDGTGYPHGLSSNLISTYAKMAAIVDIYENMIAKGMNTPDSPVSPFEAIKILWDLRRTWLNPTLVQQFAHCVGLFPVGSLIELNTGEVAIVLTQSRTNRMQPTIMIVLDKEKQPYDSPITVDLANNPECDNMAYEIVRDLKPAAYNIDPEKYYL